MVQLWCPPAALLQARSMYHQVPGAVPPPPLAPQRSLSEQLKGTNEHPAHTTRKNTQAENTRGRTHNTASALSPQPTHHQKGVLPAVVKVQVDVAVPLQGTTDRCQVSGTQLADAGIEQVALGAAGRKGQAGGQRAAACGWLGTATVMHNCISQAHGRQHTAAGLISHPAASSHRTASRQQEGMAATTGHDPHQASLPGPLVLLRRSDVPHLYFSRLFSTHAFAVCSYNAMA